MEPVPDPATDPAGFVRATQAEVRRFVAALVDPGTADDLTQETYLRAFRGLGEFAGRSSTRTWLLAIARHVCADHIRTVQRRRRLDARLPEPEPVPDPAGLVGAMDLLRELPDERREAFVLTQLVGLSYEEAAAACEVALGTIRSRVARARMQLVAAATVDRAGTFR
ncbi:MAG: RNA polymerase subunit sigma [Actinobacteria bacterium 13_2_20CM_2_71_6]|nr:MAG: RNA polymerase subunit sigma [Actinobacteria bacterium 13_2_20CM_2_71_6]